MRWIPVYTGINPIQINVVGIRLPNKFPDISLRIKDHPNLVETSFINVDKIFYYIIRMYELTTWAKKRGELDQDYMITTEIMYDFFGYTTREEYFAKIYSMWIYQQTSTIAIP